MYRDDDEEELSFGQRHPGVILLIIILVVAPAIYFAARKLSSSHASASREDIVMIRLPPPPPPPKPKPTPTPDQQPTPEQEQKMIEQQPVKQESKPQPKAPAPPAIGTSITGPGGPDMGLTSGLGGSGGYNGGGGGSKFGWYASEVQSRVAEAIRNNARTRKASMNIVVSIWPDSTGRITKVRLAGSTGDAALDSTLENDVLNGLQLTEGPPSDMPLPIVMRLSATRPH